MKQANALNRIRARRKVAVRSKIFGTASRPRLAIFRSNQAISAQLIDDEKGKTLLAASSRGLSAEIRKKPKIKQAEQTGELLGREAVKKGIKAAVLDRRSYRYHGRVLAFAEGVRKAGLII